jgi:carboxylesterase
MTTLFPTIMTGAEPYFYRGGAAGVLVLHGFTASPAEPRWLGTHLAAQGMTVYIPRITGHGTDQRDIARMRWRDWYFAALDGYHVLRQQCEQVFVVGHSMGGVLALLVAAHTPVDAAVVLASPVQFRSRVMASAHLLKYVMPYTDQSGDSTLTETIRVEQVRRGEPVIGRVRYHIWSTAAVAQLYDLVNTARDVLPQVTAPLLLVYSEADTVVPLENAAIITAAVRSTVVEQHTVPNSDHILIQDHERDAVFQWVSAFIQPQQSG